MAYTSTKTFHFEIVTKTGGHVNTSARGHDVYEAIYNLQKQYPGCTVVRSW